MSTSSASSTPSATSSTAHGVPRLGGVRCYWALLAPRYPNPNVPGSKLELVFIHPDPVLAVHLASQRLSMMGRGVLEFIHPAEREQARKDLSNAISLDDLQGSVTRVRFARLSWIRRLLGCKPEELEVPYDAATFAEDDQYLILDIVINWVAEGMLLAFFHAIRDKDPQANNDPNKKNEEWSNYCGTARMGDDQIEALHESVSKSIPVPTPTRFPPYRVFQMYTNAEYSVQSSSLVFSWPPARPSGQHTINDGSYDAQEYVDLMQGVNICQDQYRSRSGATHTNCTTRFGATHSITSEGAYRHVSSVFIPYGTLVFACFQTTRQVELQPRLSIGSTTSTLEPGPAQNQAVPTVNGVLPAEPYGNVSNSQRGNSSGPDSYGLPTPTADWALPLTSDWSRQAQSQPVLPSQPLSDPYATHGYPPPVPAYSPPKVQPPPSVDGRSAGLFDQAAVPHYPSQYRESSHFKSVQKEHRIDEPDNPFLPLLDQPTSLPTLNPPSNQHHHLHQPEQQVAQYSPTHQTNHRANYGYQTDSHPDPSLNAHSIHQSLLIPQPAQSFPLPPLDHSHQSQYQRHTYQQQTFSQQLTAYPVEHEYPSRRPEAIPSYPTPSPSTQNHQDTSPPNGASANGTSRPLIPPPGDVECCRLCGGKESPEWRRSESGVKDLCNACGLRLARQVAKREGRQKPRKKKEKI